MTQQPKQIEIENLHFNVWRLNTEVVPPNDLRVLCCDENGKMWFDTFNRGWSSPIAPSVFAWQHVAPPMIF